MCLLCMCFTIRWGCGFVENNGILSGKIVGSNMERHYSGPVLRSGSSFEKMIGFQKENPDHAVFVLSIIPLA